MITIEIKDNSREAIARYSGGDKTSIKTISINELIAAVSKDLEITTGILPSGTRFYSGTKKQYCIGMQVPAKVRTVKFSMMDKSYMLPFPELLFVFSIRDKNIIKTKLFACIPPIGRKHDMLYLFPFGNVYEDGSICWGSVNRYNVEEPAALDGMVASFFSSVFSGHLTWGTRMFHPPADSGVGDLRGLVEYLSGKEHFPDNILKASSINIGSALGT